MSRRKDFHILRVWENEAISDDDDENIEEMQKEVEDILLKITKKKKVSNILETEPLRFDIKVEVEEYNEQSSGTSVRTHRQLRTTPTEDPKPESQNSLCNQKIQESSKSSQQQLTNETSPESNSNLQESLIPPRPPQLQTYKTYSKLQPILKPKVNYVYSQQFDLKTDAVIKTMQNLSVNGNIADNYIYLLMRNFENMPKPPVLSDFEYALEKVLKVWRDWYLKDVNVRGAPLLYKCKICGIAWWYLQTFKDHVKNAHRNVVTNLKFEFETTNGESYIAVKLKQSKMAPEVRIENTPCWRCGMLPGVKYKHFNTETLMYHCQCWLQYSTCYEFRLHMDTCAIVNPSQKLVNYKCHLCFLRFDTCEELRSHRILSHTVRSDLPVAWAVKTCKRCDMLYYHGVHDCPTKKRTFNIPCNFCTRMFRTQTLLTLHQSFSKEKEQCRLCPHVLDRQCMEVIHLVKHTSNYILLRKCVLCQDNNYFYSDKFYDQHLLIKHPTSSTTSVQVPIPLKCLQDSGYYIPSTDNDIVLHSVHGNIFDAQKRKAEEEECPFKRLKHINNIGNDKTNVIDTSQYKVEEQNIEEFINTENEINKMITIKNKHNNSFAKIKLENVDGDDMPAKNQKLESPSVDVRKLLNFELPIENNLVNSDETCNKSNQATVNIKCEIDEDDKTIGNITCNETIDTDESPNCINKNDIRQNDLLNQKQLNEENTSKSTKEDLGNNTLKSVEQNHLQNDTDNPNIASTNNLLDEDNHKREQIDYPESSTKSIIFEQNDVIENNSNIKIKEEIINDTDDGKLVIAEFNDLIRDKSVKLEVSEEPEDCFEDDMIVWNDADIDETGDDDDRNTAAQGTSNGFLVWTPHLGVLGGDIDGDIDVDFENEDEESNDNDDGDNDDLYLSDFKKKKRRFMKCTECSFEGNTTEVEHRKYCGRPKTFNPWKRDGFTCTTCSKRFSMFEEYLHHLPQHSYRKHQCPQCLQTFSQRGKLLCHVAFHINRCYVPNHGIRVPAKMKQSKMCSQCLTTVKTGQFFWHWERHLTEARRERDQPVDLEKYAPESPALKELIALLLDSSSSNELQAVKLRWCAVCARRFTRTNECKRHYIEHLLDDACQRAAATAGLRCQVCGQVWQKPADFRLHIRGHAAMPVYCCELCGKTFSDSSNFAKHRKVHDLYAYVCDLCQKKFTRKKSIIEHLKFHEPTECPFCGKVFYSETALKRHQRMIHMSPQFSCKVCRAKYDTTKQLWDHEWQVHKKRKIIADCPLCDSQFRKFLDVKAHLKDVHGRDGVRQEFGRGRNVVRLRNVGRHRDNDAHAGSDDAHAGSDDAHAGSDDAHAGSDEGQLEVEHRVGDAGEKVKQEKIKESKDQVKIVLDDKEDNTGRRNCKLLEGDGIKEEDEDVICID